MVSVSSEGPVTRQTAIIIGIATALVTVLATYLYKKLKEPKIPTEWTPVGKVARLCIYPLKSCMRLEVEKAECTQQGLMEVKKTDKSFRLRDRSFVVYNETNYEFRTARQCPQLVLIKVTAHDANSVALNAPNMETLILRVPSKKDHEVVTIQQHMKEQIKSIDCGDEAAAWISRYILEKDRGLRISYSDGSFKRNKINELYKASIDYHKMGLRNESTGLNSDLAAMHIINRASVDDYVKRFDDISKKITVENFRPTLMVDGPNLKPYDEDNWVWIKVGDVVMKSVSPCFRCMFTTIDPKTGTRNLDREPLKSLEKYRVIEGPDKSPVMGILLEVFETGIISKGDTVYVSKAL